MLKLHRITLCCFRGFTHLDLDLRHNRIRIQGKNGVGKSTIVEAITWALFNRPRKKYKDLVSWSCSNHREIRVELELETRRERYRLLRSYGDAEIHSDSVHVFGVNKVESFVREELKTSYDEMRASCLCLQGDATWPLKMPRGKRSKLFNQMFSIEENSTTHIVDISTKLKKNDEDLQKLEEHEEEQLRKISNILKELKKQLELRSEHTVLQSENETLRRKHDFLKKLLSFYEHTLQHMNNGLRHSDILDSTGMEQEIFRSNKMAEDLQDKRLQLRELRHDRLRCQYTSEARTKLYTDTADTLSQAIHKGECPTCERRVLWRGWKKLEMKQNQARERAMHYRQRSQKAAEPTAEEIEHSEQLIQLESEIDILQDDIREVRVAKKFLSDATLLRDRVQLEWKTLVERLSCVTKQMEKIERELDKSKYCQETERDLWGRLTELESDLSKKSIETKDAREKLRKSQNDLVTEATKGDNIRNEIKESVKQTFKTLTEKGFLHQSDSIDVGEDFEPTLYETSQRSKKISSGGIDVISSLIMRLAVFQVMSRHKESSTEPPTGLVLLDEPFGNVQSEWIQEFRTVLKQEQWKKTQVIEVSSRFQEYDEKDLHDNEWLVYEVRATKESSTVKKIRGECSESRMLSDS